MARRGGKAMHQENIYGRRYVHNLPERAAKRSNNTATDAPAAERTAINPLWSKDPPPTSSTRAMNQHAPTGLGGKRPRT